MEEDNDGGGTARDGSGGGPWRHWKKARTQWMDDDGPHHIYI